MKTYLKYGLTLFMIVMIACGLLAWVNTRTEPKIRENLRIAEENARKQVFPLADRFDEVNHEKLNYYVAYDSGDNLLGYAFIAQDFGYSGIIQTMVGLNKDFTINRIAILSQSETPGLGDNCKKPDFAEKFIGLGKDALKVDKDGGPVISITGATMTTRIVTNSIKKYIEILESVLATNNAGGLI